MTAKRGHGEGSIYQRADGLWVGTIENGRDATGKRKRITVKGKLKKTVQDKMKTATDELEAGIVQSGPAMTMGEFLDQWVEKAVANRKNDEKTYANTEQIVRLHLKPTLKKIVLKKLTVEQVEAVLQTKANDGLSTSYVSRMKSTLISALDYAVSHRHATYNVATHATLPKCKDTETRVSLTQEEADRLIGVSKDDRLGALIFLGLQMGYRPGELTGLRWADLKLDATPVTLTVSQAMHKTLKGGVEAGRVKKSTSGDGRTVALPEAVVTVLKAHKARQTAERLKIGPIWQDHGLIFTTTVGTPINDSNLRRWFAALSRSRPTSPTSCATPRPR
jgi:integrase